MKSLDWIKADEARLQATSPRKRKCRHENAVGGIRPFCLDCGDWLSLGKSNDSPAAVKIEMRAAEMIACQETSLANCNAGLPDVCRCSDGRRKLKSAEDEAAARKLAQEWNG